MAGVFNGAAMMQRTHWNSLNDGGIGGALEQQDVKLRQLSEMEQHQPQHPPQTRHSIFNPQMQQHHVQSAKTFVKQPLQQQQQPATATAANSNGGGTAGSAYGAFSPYQTSTYGDRHTAQG